MTRIIFAMFLILNLFMAACTVGSCRQQVRAKEEQQKTGGKTVKVFKYDGSKQCEGGGRTAADMSSELGEIKAISMSTLNDGMMRTQVCGNETGAANVYEIKAEDLADAERRGFRVWRF